MGSRLPKTPRPPAPTKDGLRPTHPRGRGKPQGHSSPQPQGSPEVSPAPPSLPLLAQLPGADDTPTRCAEPGDSARIMPFMRAWLRSAWAALLDRARRRLPALAASTAIISAVTTPGAPRDIGIALTVIAVLSKGGLLRVRPFEDRRHGRDQAAWPSPHESNVKCGSARIARPVLTS